MSAQVQQPEKKTYQTLVLLCIRYIKYRCISLTGRMGLVRMRVTGNESIAFA